MPGISIDPSYAYTRNASCSLVKGGKGYFDRMLQMIESAVESIHLQVYIFDADETGNMIADALIRAAGRGVEVYLLCDGYASASLPEAFRLRLLENGIFFRMFEPIFRSSNFYFGRRMHHKILVTDGQHALVGGINISNKYNDMEGQHSWLDWAVYAEGQVAAELVKVCLRLWTKSRVKSRRIIEKHLSRPTPSGDVEIRLRRNDWVNNKTQITASYYEMFSKAQHDILIMSSYFLPGKSFGRALIKAADRKVRVRIILAGHSDILTAKLAERHFYRKLFRHNIEIYEYQPSILHGKIAAYDGKWCTVGSYNVNNISAYASIELNLDIKNNSCANMVHQRLEEIIEKDCIRITAAAYDRKYSLLSRFLQWSAYQVVQMLFKASTFYFRQVR